MVDSRPPVARASVHPLMHLAALAAFALVITTLTLVMIPLAGQSPAWWNWFERHSLTWLALEVAVCLVAGGLGMVLDSPGQLPSAGLDPAQAEPVNPGPSGPSPGTHHSPSPGPTESGPGLSSPSS